MSQMDQPLWLTPAWRELGQSERTGAADNPRVVALYRDAGHPEVAHDEVAWCAAFVGASLERAGVVGTRSLMARSYLAWGAPLDEGRLGAVAVFSRGADTTLGHVGFLLGEADDSLFLLGGNQSDAVTVAAMPRSRLIGLRWPAPAAIVPSTVEVSVNPDEAFQRALAHVLEMEGGYGDDPHDPGGPTNFGITLAEFASWRGVRLDQASAAELKSALRRIAPETVREIYLRRYWQPAGCGDLAEALAFMHFDAAVNHGVGTAIRFLQGAVGADQDGEIGPVTQAAIAQADVRLTLEVYAASRRRRYRALPTFWRFGRGWLARVDRTLERALAILNDGSPAQSSEGDTDMADDSIDDPGLAPGKWWGRSMTIWGAIVTGAAALAPAFGQALGVDIPASLITDAGNQLFAAVQAVGVLAGTIMTIYGRLRASRPIERRVLKLKV